MHAMVKTNVNAGSVVPISLAVLDPALLSAIALICLHAASLPADIGGCTDKTSGTRCRGSFFTQTI